MRLLQNVFLSFFFSSRRRHTRLQGDWSSDVCSSDLGLPIMDTFLAIGRRAFRGRPLFQADKEHIHHRLMASGLSHRQAVLVLYAFCVLLGAAALILTFASSGQAALLLLLLALVAFLFLRSLGYMRFDRVSESAATRRQNRSLRASVRVLGRR